MQERKIQSKKNRQTKIKGKECTYNEAHFTTQTNNALHSPRISSLYFKCISSGFSTTVPYNITLFTYLFIYLNQATRPIKHKNSRHNKNKRER